MKSHVHSTKLVAEARGRIPGGVNSPVRAFRGRSAAAPASSSGPRGAACLEDRRRPRADLDFVSAPGVRRSSQHNRPRVRAAVAGGARPRGQPRPGELRHRRNPYEVRDGAERIHGLGALDREGADGATVADGGDDVTPSGFARGASPRSATRSSSSAGPLSPRARLDSRAGRQGGRFGALTHGQPDSAGVPASALARGTVDHAAVERTAPRVDADLRGGTPAPSRP